MAAIASMAATSSLVPTLQLQAPRPTSCSSAGFPQALSTSWLGLRSEAGKCTTSLGLNGKVRGRTSRGLQVAAGISATAPRKFKTMKPLGDRVLVKIMDTEDVTPVGLFLPSSAKEKPQRGKVVAVGSGRTFGDKHVPPCVSVGDTIVYSKYAGTEVEFDGSEHVLLKESDLTGVLSSESDDIKDMKPLNQRALIKVAPVEEKTQSGIILTPSTKEKPVTGTVIAVGPGDYQEDGSLVPVDLNPGDTVLYSKFSGNEFKGKDGSTYMVIRAPSILAVMPSS